MLSHTSTEWAPWHVIPADRKWFARLGAAGGDRERADGDRPAVPRRSATSSARQLQEIKKALEAQAPKGAAPDPFEAERAGESRGLSRPPA